MTNYNDGKWHGWNGGECPVHPESEVQVRLLNPGAEYGDMTERAIRWDWACADDTKIIAFRVVKEYKEPVEPREFWIDALMMYATDEPDHCASYYIHVREVLE